jgi:hypothetical protein
VSSKFLPSLFAFTFAALALPVAAQVAVTQPNQPCKCAQQKPHPYTAEFKITHVQTLANGTTITHESTEIAAADSSGRVMGSTTQARPELEIGQWTHGHVHDPVASTDTNWDSNSHKATVMKYPAKEEQHGCWSNQAGTFHVSYDGGRLTSGSVQPPVVRAQVQHPQQATEDLGTTTIQGVEATGRRTTTTIPAGQVGNDQPIVTTQETWWSKGIGVGLLLRSVYDDPRNGTTTREATSLSLGEPDPALFQPPDGYEVKTDELHQVPCAQ